MSDRQQVTPQVTTMVPLYKLVTIRKLYLFGTFWLGFVCNLLLAIYVPELWNYMYDVAGRFLSMV